ncbi:hypothetical protein [Campylobacter blaseri]|nr:hypothetical protein [Campylobacter blaseri]
MQAHAYIGLNLFYDKDKHFSKEEVDNIINKYKKDIKNIESFKRKIDNCGNVNYDVEKRIKEIVSSNILNGL